MKKFTLHSKKPNCPFANEAHKRILCFFIALLIIPSCFAVGLIGCNKDTPTPPQEESSFEGTTLTVYSWTDPYQSEANTAWDIIEERYGFQIEWRQMDQSKQVSIVSSHIASNRQADIMLTKGSFPSVLTVLQPIENTEVNLSKFENQAILKASAIDGKPYIAAGMCRFSGDFDICVYNKNIFEWAKLATPKELYEKGEWTVENFVRLAKKISELGKEYIGAQALEESSISLSASPIYSLSKSKINFDCSEKLIASMSLLADLRESGAIMLSRGEFNNGKCGMALTTTYGLKRTGYFTTINPEHVGATLYPKPTAEAEHIVCAPMTGWGVVKGCKNLKAAGLFLKDLLNPDEEIKSNDSLYVFGFHNDEITDFYYDIYEQYNDRFVYYFCGDIANCTGIGDKFYNSWSTMSSEDIKKHITDSRPIMQQMCDKANTVLKDVNK